MSNFDPGWQFFQFYAQSPSQTKTKTVKKKKQTSSDICLEDYRRMQRWGKRVLGGV